jgi:hypothetical protein
MENKTQEQKTLLATSKVAGLIGLTVIGLSETEQEIVLIDNESKHYLVNLDSGNCYEAILRTPIKTKISKQIEDLIKEQLTHE